MRNRLLIATLLIGQTLACSAFAQPESIGKHSPPAISLGKLQGFLNFGPHLGEMVEYFPLPLVDGDTAIIIRRNLNTKTGLTESLDRVCSSAPKIVLYNNNSKMNTNAVLVDVSTQTANQYKDGLVAKFTIELPNEYIAQFPNMIDMGCAENSKDFQESVYNFIQNNFLITFNIDGYRHKSNGDGPFHFIRNFHVDRIENKDIDRFNAETRTRMNILFKAMADYRVMDQFNSQRHKAETELSSAKKTIEELKGRVATLESTLRNRRQQSENVQQLGNIAPSNMCPVIVETGDRCGVGQANGVQKFVRNTSFNAAYRVTLTKRFKCSKSGGPFDNDWCELSEIKELDPGQGEPVTCLNSPSSDTVTISGCMRK